MVFYLITFVAAPFNRQSPWIGLASTKGLAGGNGIPNPYYNVSHRCRVCTGSSMRFHQVWMREAAMRVASGSLTRRNLPPCSAARRGREAPSLHSLPPIERLILMIKMRKRNHVSPLRSYNESAPFSFFQRRTSQLHSLKFIQIFLLKENKNQGDFQEITLATTIYSKTKSVVSQTRFRTQGIDF